MSDERSEAGSQFHVIGPLSAKLRYDIVMLLLVLHIKMLRRAFIIDIAACVTCW